jgi:hypothetical protein
MFSVRGEISPHASRTLQGLRSYRARLAVLQSTRLRVYLMFSPETEIFSKQHMQRSFVALLWSTCRFVLVNTKLKMW